MTNPLPSPFTLTLALVLTPPTLTSHSYYTHKLALKHPSPPPSPSPTSSHPPPSALHPPSSILVLTKLRILVHSSTSCSYSRSSPAILWFTSCIEHACPVLTALRSTPTSFSSSPSFYLFYTTFSFLTQHNRGGRGIYGTCSLEGDLGAWGEVRSVAGGVLVHQEWVY